MAGSEEGLPRARPGERLGIFRIITEPPEMTVEVLTEVNAIEPATNRWARVVAEPQIGPSPQTVPVSFAPDALARVVVRAFLRDPLPPDEEVTLAIEVEVDGEPLVGAEDVVQVGPHNEQTAFALAVLNTDLVPPPGGEAG